MLGRVEVGGAVVGDRTSGVWRLVFRAPGESVATYTRILELDPTDRAPIHNLMQI